MPAVKFRSKSTGTKRTRSKRTSSKRTNSKRTSSKRTSSKRSSKHTRRIRKMRGGLIPDKDNGDEYDIFETGKKKTVPFRYRIITGNGKSGLSDDDKEFIGPYFISFNETNNNGEIYTLEGPQKLAIGKCVCSGVDGEQWPCAKTEKEFNEKYIVIIKHDPTANKWGWARTKEEPKFAHLCKIDDTQNMTNKFTTKKDIDFIICSNKEFKGYIWGVKVDIFYKSYNITNVPNNINRNKLSNLAITENIKQLEELRVNLPDTLSPKREKTHRNANERKEFTYRAHNSKMLNNIIEKLKLELKLTDDPNNDDVLKENIKQINKQLYIYTPPENDDELYNLTDTELNDMLETNIRSQNIYPLSVEKGKLYP